MRYRAAIRDRVKACCQALDGRRRCRRVEGLRFVAVGISVAPASLQAQWIRVMLCDRHRASPHGQEPGT